MALSDRLTDRIGAQIARSLETNSQGVALYSGFNGQDYIFVQSDGGVVYIPPSQMLSTGSLRIGDAVAIATPMNARQWADNAVR